MFFVFILIKVTCLNIPRLVTSIHGSNKRLLKVIMHFYLKTKSLIAKIIIEDIQKVYFGVNKGKLLPSSVTHKTKHRRHFTAKLKIFKQQFQEERLDYRFSNL